MDFSDFWMLHGKLAISYVSAKSEKDVKETFYCGRQRRTNVDSKHAYSGRVRKPRKNF